MIEPTLPCQVLVEVVAPCLALPELVKLANLGFGLALRDRKAAAARKVTVLHRTQTYLSIFRTYADQAQHYDLALAAYSQIITISAPENFPDSGALLGIGLALADPSLVARAILARADCSCGMAQVYAMAASRPSFGRRLIQILHQLNQQQLLRISWVEEYLDPWREFYPVLHQVIAERNLAVPASRAYLTSSTSWDYLVVLIDLLLQLSADWAWPQLVVIKPQLRLIELSSLTSHYRASGWLGLTVLEQLTMRLCQIESSLTDPITQAVTQLGLLSAELYCIQRCLDKADYATVVTSLNRAGYTLQPDTLLRLGFRYWPVPEIMAVMKSNLLAADQIGHLAYYDLEVVVVIVNYCQTQPHLANLRGSLLNNLAISLHRYLQRESQLNRLDLTTVMADFVLSDRDIATARLNRLGHTFQTRYFDLLLPWYQPDRSTSSTVGPYLLEFLQLPQWPLNHHRDLILNLVASQYGLTSLAVDPIVRPAIAAVWLQRNYPLTIAEEYLTLPIYGHSNVSLAEALPKYGLIEV